MVKRNMVLLDIDYITEDEKPVIRLLGREVEGENPKRIIALDYIFQPYFYIEPKDMDQCLKDLEVYETEDIEIVDKKDFQIPKKFIKITFSHPQEVPKYRDEIKGLDSVVDIREHDIPFYRRYLMDNDVIPMSVIEIEGDLLDSHKSVTSNYENLEIIKLNHPPKNLDQSFTDFNILSFDLEVYNPRGLPNSDIDEIIMIGVTSNFGIRKVLSTKDKVEDTDESFVMKLDSEKQMIEEFVRIVKENQVDIIVGYNSDNFDFPYLKDRAGMYGIELDLGMDGSSLKFIKRGFTDAASFKGLVHVDLYLVMRRYMSLDRYTLERVYLELFGEEKKDVPGEIIWKYWDSDNKYLDELFDYSLDDVVSTLMIAEQTLPLNLELTRIVGQPFFDITRMTTGQQAEWYLVKEAYKINEIIPNKPSAGDASRIHDQNEGGFVKEPVPGLHENLVQFDFRSLYPSIIISKNICPDVLVKGSNPLDNTDSSLSDEERYYVCPEHNHKFLKEPKGFIPSVIGNILSERLRIKKIMKESNDPTEKKMLNIQQLAIKRLINTMYGVYGYSKFRWYSFECAQAITAWGREYILYTIENAKKYGFYAIYADTDGFYAEYRGDSSDDGDSL
jgi:DNA polymerase I